MPVPDPLLKILRSAAPARERRDALRDAAPDVEVLEALLRASQRLRGQDPEGAARVARSVLALARAAGNLPLQFDARRILAEADIVLGRPNRSLRLLGVEPPADMPQVPVVGRAMTLAQTLSILGRRREAFRVIERTRAQLGRSATPWSLGLLAAAEGHMYGSADRHQEALACLDQAVDYLKEDDNRERLLSLHINRATALRALERIDEAEAIFRQVIPELERIGASEFHRWARLNLTEIDIQRGAFQDALRALRDLRAEYQALGMDARVARCNLYEAEVNLALQLPKQALDHAVRARHVFKQVGSEEDLAQTDYFMAVAERILGRTTEAARRLADAYRVLGRPGGRVGLGAICLLRLAETDHAQGEHGRAATRVQSAIDQLRELGWHERAARAEVFFAVLEVDACEPLSAERRLDELLAGPHAPKTPWVRCDVHHQRARVAEVLGKSRDALRHILTAAAILERYRVGVPPDEYMAAFLTSRAEVFEDAVRIVLRSGGRRAAERAFELSEQARARALLDLLRTSQHERESGTSRLSREVDLLAREIDGQMTTSGRDGQPDTAEMAARRAQLISDREVRLRASLDMLAVHEPDAARQHRAVPVRLKDVVQSLPSDEVLLEYYVSTQSLHIFMVRDGKLTHIRKPFGREALRPILIRMRFQLDRSSVDGKFEPDAGRKVLESAGKVLEELDQVLLGDLRPFLDKRRVVIIPHDALHCVPFPALQRGGTPLIEQAEVVVAPSAAVYMHCMQTRTSTGPALLMGYDDEFAPQIQAEISAIEAITDPHEAYTGPRAKVGVLRERGPQARVIHLATHAEFGHQDSMESKLRFSDGWLTVSQVYSMRIAPELLVLSGCATGRVTVTRGGDLFGLVRGFLHAGASSILSSLWAVSDASTREYMERFYRAFGDGLTAAAAARRATLEMREAHPHPYHWAPFLLTGRGG